MARGIEGNLSDKLVATCTRIMAYQRSSMARKQYQQHGSKHGMAAAA